MTHECTHDGRHGLDLILRLAVYGTLAPGRPNAHVLGDVPGVWVEGTVRGELRHVGWGAELGYPGIVLDPDGPIVRVAVLESSVLGQHWHRLDEFEGPGYRRTITAVMTERGVVDAAIYVLADAGRA